MELSTTTVLLGFPFALAQGLRHAFEPDHLAAVSTLLADGRGARRAAVLGAAWGAGHTLALFGVAAVLAALGAELPGRVESGFELAVAGMLVVLGVRGLWRARRMGGSGEVREHRHGDRSHVHAHAAPHVHLGERALAVRPLLIGLVHGLAGSGALTALVASSLSGTAARLGFVLVFGVGSIAAMALATVVAGWSLARVDHRLSWLHAGLAALSIAIGLAWGAGALEGLLA
jgi:hypothetical protein